MVSIYILINPLDEQVFYVGATCDPAGRLKLHIYEKGSTYKHLIIERILNKNLKPEMVILEETESKNVRFTEEFYINLFKFYGFKIHQTKSRYMGTRSSYKEYTKNGLTYSIRLDPAVKGWLYNKMQAENRSLGNLVNTIIKREKEREENMPYDKVKFKEWKESIEALKSVIPQEQTIEIELPHEQGIEHVRVKKERPDKDEFKQWVENIIADTK